MTAPATDEDLRELVRAQLDGTDAGKANLAHRLGIGAGALSTLLRSRQAIGPGVAAALGYRAVVRYERVDPLQGTRFERVE